MCIGIPMIVIESGFGFALCEGMGTMREVDTLLVGEQQPGTWLLVFLNSAREVISAEDAALMTKAVQAVDHVMAGHVSDGPLTDHVIESMFADLIHREPEKPPSLIALETYQEEASNLPKNT